MRGITKPSSLIIKRLNNHEVFRLEKSTLMLPLTIWMNMPSFYQNDLFAALASTGKVDLKVIFARDLPEERRSLGWKSEIEGYEAHFLNPEHPLRDAGAEL
ncbi:MAG: hypothetical protein EOP06_31530, partial [Proteobacteria bacterium]